MHRLALAAVIAALAVGAAACADPEIPTVVALPTPLPTATATPTPVATLGPTPTPAASQFEPGVTDATLRVAVIADVTTGDLTAELGGSAWTAVQAWAAAVNSEGGLAGRQVEVVTIDAAILEHGAAVEQACAGEVFALVGSAALFDSEGLDTLLAPSCRLPDFPATVQSQERLDSPVTFVSNPVMGSRWNVGWARYWAERAPRAVLKAGTLIPDAPPLVVGSERLIEASTAAGFTYVAQPQVPFLDADYEDAVAAMVEEEVSAVTWAADGVRFLDLLRALADAEAEPTVLDCGPACYHPAWASAAGELGADVSVWLSHLPFEEVDQSPELTRYLFWLRAVDPEAVPTSVGVEAWAGALLFQEAVERAVGAGTDAFEPGSLTRAAVVEAAAGITAWTARGIHGETDPGAREPSPCFVVLNRARGSWQRVYPARRGQLDCAADNLYTLEQTAGLEEAVDPTVEPGSTPTEEPTAEDLGDEGLDE